MDVNPKEVKMAFGHNLPDGSRSYKLTLRDGTIINANEKALKRKYGVEKGNEMSGIVWEGVDVT